MKKIILLLCFVPFIGFSQECKFEKNEIDTFYKTKIIKTQRKPIAFEFAGNAVDFQFLFNKDPFIIIKVDFSYLKKMETKPENNLLILLNDNQVITYNINEIKEGSMSGNGGPMSSTSFEFQFKTSIEELKLIKNIGIKKIRFEYSDGSKEFEVNKKKFIDKTNANLDCFINEITK